MKNTPPHVPSPYPLNPRPRYTHKQFGRESVPLCESRGRLTDWDRIRGPNCFSFLHRRSYAGTPEGTIVSQPCLSSARPSTSSKNAVCNFSVTGPRRPLPT